MKLVSKIFDGTEPRSIDSRHVAQTKNDDGGQRVQRIDDLSEFVGCSEEKWSVNAKNGGVLWNILPLQNVHAAVFHIVAGDPRDRGGARYLTNEHERSKHHANFDS